MPPSPRFSFQTEPVCFPQPADSATVDNGTSFIRFAFPAGLDGTLVYDALQWVVAIDAGVVPVLDVAQNSATEYVVHVGAAIETGQVVTVTYSGADPTFRTAADEAICGYVDYPAVVI